MHFCSSFFTFSFQRKRLSEDHTQHDSNNDALSVMPPFTHSQKHLKILKTWRHACTSFFSWWNHHHDIDDYGKKEGSPRRNFKNDDDLKALAFMVNHKQTKVTTPRSKLDFFPKKYKDIIIYVPFFTASIPSGAASTFFLK